MAAQQYHLHTVASRVLFRSKHWISLDYMIDWLDSIEDKDISVRLVRQQILNSLDSLKFSQNLVVQFPVNDVQVCMGKPPFKELFVRMRALFNTRGADNANMLNRAGTAVAVQTTYSVQSDASLSFHKIVEAIRDACMNEIYLYDQAKFDLEFDWF